MCTRSFACFFASLVCLALIFLWPGLFNAYASTCSWPELVPAAQQPTKQPTRALIIADPHILGNRRGKLDLAWTDWALHSAFSALLHRHRPDVVLHLGDLFDSGRSATWSQWTAYLSRARHIFQTETPSHFTVGNHDIGWAYRLSPSAEDRFSASVGPANELFHVSNISFLKLNAMALDTRAPRSSRGELKQMLDQAAKSGTDRPDVLLLHMPLYRKSDQECGRERELDRTGSTTTYDMDKALEPRDDVIDAESSNMLLQRLQPRLILSGHLHTPCRFHHESGAWEFTIPTFGWRMRPDPSYGLLTLGQDPFQFEIAICKLPNEHATFAVLGGLLAGLLSPFLVVICPACGWKKQKYT